MSAAHTPGPWLEEIDDYENKRTGWINGADDKPIVDYAGCGSHEATWPNPADMVLVLAAPDIAKALKDLLEHAYFMTDCGPPGGEWKSGELEAAIAAAEKALAKAGAA